MKFLLYLERVIIVYMKINHFFSFLCHLDTVLNNLENGSRLAFIVSNIGNSDLAILNCVSSYKV